MTTSPTSNASRFLLLSITGTFVLVIAMVVLLVYGRSGIRVVVHNKTGARISECRVSCAGNARDIAVLEGGESVEVSIQADAPTALELSYRDADGHPRQEDLAYLEPSFKGTIRVMVNPDGSVECEDDISVY